MKGILTFLLLTFSILSIAQTKTNEVVDVKIDERLFDVYEQKYLSNLQAANPNLLLRWSFYLDNAFYITDFPKGKENADAPEVVIDDLEKINILLLEKDQRLTRDFKKRNVYKIQGTQKALIYFSGEEFNQKLNEHLGRK